MLQEPVRVGSILGGLPRGGHQVPAGLDTKSLNFKRNYAQQREQLMEKALHMLPQCTCKCLGSYFGLPRGIMMHQGERFADILLLAELLELEKPAN